MGEGKGHRGRGIGHERGEVRKEMDRKRRKKRGIE